MDIFSELFNKAKEVKGEIKDAKEQIASANYDEEGGGKYFQSSRDESDSGDPILKKQMQNLPEVALTAVDCVKI